MFSVFVFITILIPVIALVIDARRTRSWDLVFSHFWFFTLIWLVAFPIKALALDSGFTTAAAQRALSTEDLTSALGLSFLLWLGVYAGNFWFRNRGAANLGADVSAPSNILMGRIAVVLILATVISVPMSMWAHSLNIGSRSYFSYRLGIGPLLLLAELVPLAVMATAISVLAADFQWRAAKVALISFGFGVLVSAPITVILESRRIVAACLLSVVIALALRAPRLRGLALVSVLGTVFGSIPLQALRYAQVPDYALDYDFLGKTKAFFTIMKDVLRYQINHSDGSVFKSLFDSFEGIEHVATLIKNASWQQLAFGIDHGLSWLYNMGLSLAPRAIWSAKPLIYGNNAQQYFLYPEWFKDGLMIVAMPPSFVVDFVFGFGVLGALLLALVLGRVFRVAEGLLTQPGANMAARAFSLFLFINMFNIVRSGTSIVQSLILFSIVVIAVYGWRLTMNAMQDFVRS